MAEEDRATASIKIPTWDGAEGEKAQIYVTKLESVAELGGYAEALETSYVRQLPATEGEATQTEAQQRAVKHNKKARAAIAQGTCSEKGMEHIRAGKTPEHPKGLACKMAKAIKDAVQKQDNVTAIELEADTAETTMQKDDDPKVSFDKVSKVRFKYERDDDPNTRIPDAKVHSKNCNWSSGSA